MSRLINKSLFILFTFICIYSCAYYNTMFNAFKLYDEGNLKIANSKDGKITPDIKKTFNSAIEKCWTLINIHGDSSDWADDALLLIGKSHYLIEEYSSADRFLNQFLKKYPKSELLSETKIWYAKVLIKTEKDDEALEMLNGMLINDMDDDLKAQTLSSIGNIYFLREDYNEAIKRLKACIEVSNDDILSATSQYQIGKIQYDLKQYVDAIESFNLVLDYDPPEELEFNALINKVDAQINLEKLDLAIKTLSQMLRNVKIKDKYSIVEAKLGQCFVLQEKKEYAIDHFFDVIERYPRTLGSAWSVFQIAELLEDYFILPDSARKMYLKVKQESAKSEYAEESTERANLLKKYLDIKSKIEQNRIDFKAFTEMLLDTTLADTLVDALPDTLIDSLAIYSSINDSDSVAVASAPKETKESITKKLQDAEKDLVKNTYDLAEFFLLTKQNYDSAATAYIHFIDSGLDTSRIPKAYHALSYIYKFKMKDSTKADSIDKIILEKFPNSKYSKFILTLNSPEQDKKIVEKDPMKEKFLVAERYLFNDNFYNALDTLISIAEKDSGNNWGGKARYAISWIYENKIKDIDKALESYTLLEKEYPRSEYAKIAKNKIKIPKVETPVDTSTLSIDTTITPVDTAGSDSTAAENPQNGNDEIIKEQEKPDKEVEVEDEKKPDIESKELEPLPLPLGLIPQQYLIKKIEKGAFWNRYLA